jgi:hypothetical protein
MEIPRASATINNLIRKLLSNKQKCWDIEELFSKRILKLELYITTNLQQERIKVKNIK